MRLTRLIHSPSLVADRIDSYEERRRYVSLEVLTISLNGAIQPERCLTVSSGLFEAWKRATTSQVKAWTGFPTSHEALDNIQGMHRLSARVNISIKRSQLEGRFGSSCALI